ncbi:MAG TPA: antibiotic biosynthesis monooxygenase [Chloroflexia bacterium]|nr:antibiotic biosynthesis monooxygenase [Chloroflexia bacterium]
MYTYVRRYNVKPESVNEVIRLAVEGFVPIISRERGFLAYDLMNSGNGTVTSISTFDNQVAAENANILTMEWVNANLASLVTEPPLIISGKVSVHKTRQDVR